MSDYWTDETEDETHGENDRKQAERFSNFSCLISLLLNQSFSESLSTFIMSDTVVIQACLPCEEEFSSLGGTPTVSSSPSLHSSGDVDKKRVESHGVYESAKSLSTMKVVLDLDECLVHSRAATAEDGYAGVGFVLETDGARPESVHVTLRPHLVDFLRAITSRYETYIFTAGQERYASPLLNILELSGEKKFTHRFYPKDLTYHQGLDSNVKDLRAAFTRNGLEYDPRRVVLIDNLTQNFALNPSNGIPIVDFVGDQRDSALMDLIPFLRELEKFQDVRPVLERMFHLKQDFAQYEVLQEEEEEEEEEDVVEDVVMEDVFEEEDVVDDVHSDIIFDSDGDVVMHLFEDEDGGDDDDDDDDDDGDLLVGLDFVDDESDTSSLALSECDNSLLFDEEEGQEQDAEDDGLLMIFPWEVGEDSSFEIAEVDDVDEEFVAEVEIDDVNEVVEAETVVPLRRSPRLRNVPRVDYTKFF